MQSGQRFRPVIAIVAAYVVALQALLLPFSIASAAPVFAVLCSGATSDESPTAPAGHAAGCAGCGMQCGSLAALPPPEPDLAPLGGWTLTERPALVLIAAAGTPRRDPQIPRAPPLA